MPELESKAQELKAKKEAEIERWDENLKRKRAKLAERMLVWSSHPQFEYWSSVPRNAATVDEEMEEVVQEIQRVRQNIEVERGICNQNQGKMNALESLRMEHQGQKDQLVELERERAQLDRIWNDQIQAQMQNRYSQPRNSSEQSCPSKRLEDSQPEHSKSMDVSDEALDLSSAPEVNPQDIPNHPNSHGTPKPSPNPKLAPAKITPKRPSLSALFAATPSPKMELSLTNKLPSIGKLSLPTFPKINPPRPTMEGPVNLRPKASIPIIFPPRAMGDTLRGPIKSSLPPLNLKLNLPKANFSTLSMAPKAREQSSSVIPGNPPNCSPTKETGPINASSKALYDGKNISPSTSHNERGFNMKFGNEEQSTNEPEKEFSFGGFDFRANDANTSATNFNMEGQEFGSFFGNTNANQVSDKRNSAGDDPFQFTFNF